VSHLRICGLAVAILVAARLPAAAQAPLEPGELLRSVERALPLLERARQEVTLAGGQLEEARGAFDLTLDVSGKAIRGFYDNERVTGGLVQPLSAFGATVYGGYRLGRGLFAPYDTGNQTLSLGEYTAGVELPLLRNRNIDARRAERQSAALGLSIAERGLDTTRLSLYKEALSDYWDWVAAGAQRDIAQGLLDLALTRDQQLADSVALGQIAAVERTDNRRAILQRRSALVAAERQLQGRAIDLSLFQRLADGAPNRPDNDRLPSLPRPAADVAMTPENIAIATALARRPELQVLRFKRDQQDVQVRLASNSRQPSLDLFSEVARDVGAGSPSRVPAAFQGGLSFQFPLQNRKASGKEIQARAKLASTSAEIRWLEDRVRAEVQDALSALDAARQSLSLLSEELTVARELEGLERDRFALGDSTQFLVNLRELATADAAIREARALADYQKALVVVEAATGTILDRVPR
jgi:cobalt-zinc-cadmium efflux system outer membrane protein